MMRLRVFSLLPIVFTILLSSSILGQSTAPTYPTELSKSSVSQFISWLVGTQWEYVDSNRKNVVLKFATPAFMLLTETAKDGSTVHSFHECTIADKGVIEWRGNSFDESAVNKCKIDENMAGAFILSGDFAFAAKLKERSQPKFPRIGMPEFINWLLSNDLVSDVGTISFMSPIHCSVKGKSEFHQSSYQPRAPGIVSLKVRDGSNALIILNQELNGFELICNGRNTKGLVQQKSATRSPVTVTPSVRNGMAQTEDNQVYPEIQLSTQSAGINGLLISDLGNSRYAGGASKLSVSALKLEGGKVASLAFNQEVGPDMSKALGEVKRFMTIRHGGWPRDYAIELSFADKYTPKDGPSAAVACALILESIITGVQLSPSFAVTGDLNADGTVQPIGGVAAKLRGAGKSGMQIVAIPEKNRTSAVDLMIMEGVTPFLGAQIVSINTFDEALSMASQSKSEVMQKALDNFSSLTVILKQNPAALRSAPTVQILSEVSTAIPNHISAKLLLAAAQNRVPGRLSPAGSLEAIDQAIGGILEAVGTDLSATGGLDAGQLGYAKTRLNRLRMQVDARVNPLVDAWLGWAALADQIIVRRSAPPHVVTQFRAAAVRINSEEEKLKGNVEFNEALER